MNRSMTIMADFIKSVRRIC